MLNDLAGATPWRIDTKISSLTGQIAAHRQVASNAIETLHYRVGDDRHPPVGRQRRGPWKLSLAQTLERAEQAANPIVELITYREAEKGIAILKESVIVLQEEFARRPWPRFFEVISSNGHVHSSTGCSTCRDTTTFAWHPESTGKNEEAAVQECGPFLCTVCFPTAPVAWTRDRGRCQGGARRSHWALLLRGFLRGWQPREPLSVRIRRVHRVPQQPVVDHDRTRP